jgi:phosphoribosyl-dephospho-CoA transferase
MDVTREQKGRRGQEILDDPVFLEMVERVREGYVIQWTLTAPGAVDEREALSAANRGLDETMRGLRRLVEDWTIDQTRRKTKSGYISEGRK